MKATLSVASDGKAYLRAFAEDETERDLLRRLPIDKAHQANHGLFVHLTPSVHADVGTGWLAAKWTHLPESAIHGEDGA